MTVSNSKENSNLYTGRIPNNLSANIQYTVDQQQIGSFLNSKRLRSIYLIESVVSMTRVDAQCQCVLELHRHPIGLFMETCSFLLHQNLGKRLDYKNRLVIYIGYDTVSLIAIIYNIYCSDYLILRTRSKSISFFFLLVPIVESRSWVHNGARSTTFENKRSSLFCFEFTSKADLSLLIKLWTRKFLKKYYYCSLFSLQLN